VTFATSTSSSYIDDFAVLVHKLKNMGNVNAMFAIANMDDRIYIVGRSRINEVNVGAVLSTFGGGGHATAASATVHDMTLTQAEQDLHRMLESSIVPAAVAQDMMSTPVKSIVSDSSLQDASQMLTRYNINVLPVVDEKQRLVGLISRQIIEKALHHGLDHIKVKEYMTTELVSVGPDAELVEIQEKIIENKQRILPVIDNGIITGVITRTDLLNILVGQSQLVSSNSTDPFKEPVHVRTRNVLKFMKERLFTSYSRHASSDRRKSLPIRLQCLRCGWICSGSVSVPNQRRFRHCHRRGRNRICKKICKIRKCSYSLLRKVRHCGNYLPGRF